MRVNAMHVLVIDDSFELRTLLQRALTVDGHVVDLADDVAQARVALAMRDFDVLVLDLALPDGTGIDLCRELRQQQVCTPILILTAHSEVPQRVAGLDAGADDFLAKPFAVAELRARVRALARRGPLERSSIVQVGRAQLELATRKATCAGGQIPLTSREWSVLEVLIVRQGRLVTRSAILEAVWGEATDNTNASLDVIMGRIRRKLGANAIRTVRGEGYATDVN